MALKKYEFEVVGKVEVVAEDELEARDSAMEILSSSPQDYIGDLLSESELPKCKMSSE